MSSFILKIIAMFTMLLDHTSYILFGISNTTFLNYIGRFAIYIFCFQIVLGYKKTSNLKKYLFRLFFFALISQIPYYLFFSAIRYKRLLNIEFTLFLGLLSISILNFHKDSNGKISFRDTDYKYINIHSKKSILLFLLKCLIIGIVCTFAAHLEYLFGYGIEYGYKSILFMVLIYLFYPFDKKQPILKTLLYLLSVIIFAFVEAQLWFGLDNFVIPTFYSMNDLNSYICIYIFCIIGGLLPLLYNGKKGKTIKWVTYFFYPIHLLVLYFFSMLLK